MVLVAVRTDAVASVGAKPFLGLDSNFYRIVLPLILAETCLWGYAYELGGRACQVLLSLQGLWWCFAALWVEVKLAQTYPGFDYHNPPVMEPYRPFCDFAPWAQCSVVLMSPPGRILRYLGIAKPGAGSTAKLDQLRHLIDVPNPTLGVAFFGCHLLYPLLVLLPIPILGPLIPELFYLACCFVGVMTLWLAYNLFFVLRDFCVVCVSMYVTNGAIIPMMHGLVQNGTGENFFGGAPLELVLPFLAMDLIMGAAVLKLFMSGPAHEDTYASLPAGP